MERIPPFRIRVERKPPSVWAVLLIFLFFVSLLLVLFLQSPLSHIKSITIIGGKWTSKQQILQQSGLYSGISYFGVRKNEVEERLKKLPTIHQVGVMKQFPNSISIKVEEHPIVAYLEADQAYIPILLNGTLLLTQPASSKLERVPIFKGWDKKQAVFPLLMDQFVRIPSTIRGQINAVYPMVGEPDGVVLITNRHHQVRVRVDRLAKRMKQYPQFVKQPPGILHMLDSVWFTPKSN